MTRLEERITVDPGQCGGRPCIRGMRIRVVDVLDLLAHGLSVKQVVEDLPDLEPEDVQACLRFANDRFDDPPPSRRNQPLAFDQVVKPRFIMGALIISTDEG